MSSLDKNLEKIKSRKNERFRENNILNEILKKSRKIQYQRKKKKRKNKILKFYKKN